MDTFLPIIQNIVTTAKLDININLNILKGQHDDIQYNPSKFNAAIMRHTNGRDSKTTCLIFGNGKMVCMGAKNEEEAKRALEYYASIIQERMGGNDIAKVEDFKIQNIVSSFDYGKKVNLYNFHSKYKHNSVFEPEMFPGLSYKHPRKLSIQIFNSGKIVITGAKNFDDMNEAFLDIICLINSI